MPHNNHNPGGALVALNVSHVYIPQRRGLRKTVMITVSVLSAVIVIALAVMGGVFYTVGIVPGGFERLILDRFDVTIYPAHPARVEAVSWWNEKSPEIMRITSGDGLPLQGYYIENENPGNKLVVLAHGYQDSAESMAIYAQIYYDLGFDIFAPDNRAHGASGGNAYGMGWLDRLDYLLWLEHLLSEKGGDLEIMLHGESMGAATVCSMLGENLPGNVKGVVSDSSFDSITNEFSWILTSRFNFPSFPAVPLASLTCKLRAGYFFGEGDVTARVADSKIPILFIHGEADTFVPFEMVFSLYQAAPPTLRELWTVPLAGHCRSVVVDTEGYSSFVSQFASKVLTTR